MKNKPWVLAVLFVIAATSLWYLLQYRFGSKSLIGQSAPNFSLNTATQNKKSLEEFRGKKLLINFWASDCPPCIGEMDSLENLYQKLKSQNFEVVAISLDRNWQDVENFLKAKKLTFPILHDPTGEIASRYNVNATPETFLLDEDFHVVDQIIGAREWDRGAMFEKIQKFVQGKSPANIH